MTRGNLTPDEWRDRYNKKDEEEQFNFLKETLASGVTGAFAKQSGLGESIVSMFDHLFHKKRYGQLLELEAILHALDAEIVGSDRHYADFFCLEVHLFKRDLPSIKMGLRSFVADPVESIDLLIPVFNKLNYYGYAEIALQISKEVYHRVRDADTLIGGAEEDFARTILMNEFQNLYQSNGHASAAGRKEFIDRLALYDYKDEDVLCSVFNLLPKDVDCSVLRYQDFRENSQYFYHKLSTGFCKYALEQKGINFPTAYDIWMGAWENFSKEAPEEGGGLEHFFKLNQMGFYDYVSGRFGFLSNKKPYAVAASWGMPYVYDFLKLNHLIPDEIYLQALEFIVDMKMEVVEGQGDSIWRYGFVHAWARPDSVSEKDFFKEKEYFEKTFTEKANIKDYLPVEYFQKSASNRSAIRSGKTVKYNNPKIGRNEPCPCGSGKKYKKCCE